MLELALGCVLAGIALGLWLRAPALLVLMAVFVPSAFAAAVAMGASALNGLAMAAGAAGLIQIGYFAALMVSGCVLCRRADHISRDHPPPPSRSARSWTG